MQLFFNIPASISPTYPIREAISRIKGSNICRKAESREGQRGISIYRVRPLKWSVFSGERSPFRIMAKLIAYTTTQSPSIRTFYIHMYDRVLFGPFRFVASVTSSSPFDFECSIIHRVFRVRQKYYDGIASQNK